MLISTPGIDKKVYIKNFTNTISSVKVYFHCISDLPSDSCPILKEIKSN